MQDEAGTVVKEVKQIKMVKQNLDLLVGKYKLVEKESLPGYKN